MKTRNESQLTEKSNPFNKKYATKEQVKKATQEGIKQYKNALKELAKR